MQSDGDGNESEDRGGEEGEADAGGGSSIKDGNNGDGSKHNSGKSFAKVRYID